MEITISVKRQHSASEKAYIQTFHYSGNGKLTVADWLTEVNQAEASNDPIAWECSCLEKKCGACAMVINGRPMLSCSCFLENVGKKGKIRIEPLSKFPIVRDLVTDRKVMFEALKKMKIWMNEKSGTDFSFDYELQYQASQCLMCGCCLEVCPNFMADRNFAGAAGMVQAYKTLEQSMRDGHYDEMAEKLYLSAVCHLPCRPRNIPFAPFVRLHLTLLSSATKSSRRLSRRFFFKGTPSRCRPRLKGISNSNQTQTAWLTINGTKPIICQPASASFLIDS